MTFFLHTFFHNKTNDRTDEGKVYIPDKREDWPIEWKEVKKKVYANFPEVNLPKIRSVLFELTQKRDASLVRIKHQTLSLEEISSILLTAYGEFAVRDAVKRTVPSGGGLYSLEIYIVVRDGHGLLPGIYHYSPEGYVLQPVIYAEEKEMKLFFSKLSSYSFLWNKTFAIIITSKFDVPISKYGSRGYRYILLEAGHVGQNIVLQAAEYGKSALPIAGFNEEVFEQKIGLTDGNERVVYAIYI